MSATGCGYRPDQVIEQGVGWRNMSATACVLVTGATGFVGKRLVPELIERGHEVKSMTRNPDDYDGPGDAVYGDVHDPGTLADAFDGVDVAVYLVHSLDDDDFERKDAEAARGFGIAAAQAGVRQIVYLGGLGEEDGKLSAHLRSRREVETLLGESGVPVTVLRAAIVVGAGGISWEITRQLVKNLPAMVVPKWASTLSQPIGIDDVVRYLVGVIDNAGGDGAGLRDRRRRPAVVPRDAAAGGRGDERAPRPDRDGAGADAEAVVSLDRPGHRRRCHHRRAT